MSLKTSVTKLTINFFHLIYYLRYLITKSLPLNHLVVYCLTNSNGFFRLSPLGIFCGRFPVYSHNLFATVRQAILYGENDIKQFLQQN
jgi:hypothetical protein